MRSGYGPAALILSGLVLAPHPDAGAQEPRRIALRCGRLLDGRHGTPVEDATIVGCFFENGNQGHQETPSRNRNR